jgi:LmbE family N-acetylglucosaminyl deacetylase
MRYCFILVLLVAVSLNGLAQTPKTYTSSEILQQIKKLNMLGSVLYIAAHPDDENTRLLAYLANEKLYRTGYLSLTRGDGGQNLIGDEQGIDLGLIRTQELLAARRIDGAEQFFSRAYDFGFCKSPEEALATWDHDKILSDAVWVIRKFKPDVIIARFPEDSRAGHGHHAASGIIAREAFDAAADPNKFPEQLKLGVSVWQAKRMLWNTFNFGGTSTQREDQFKLEVGLYNPLLGKGYGEIAALSRSQHKSQGFGVPAQRGSVLEYFETIKGDKPVNDLMDGVDNSWSRVGNNNRIQLLVDSVIKNYDAAAPEKSLKQLVLLYQQVDQSKDAYWKEQKQNDLKKLLEYCSGLFMEATAPGQYAVLGDSAKITSSINNRLGLAVKNAAVNVFDSYHAFETLPKNNTINFTQSVFIRKDQKATQPYWLENRMDKGSFNITDQTQIGKAENEPLSVLFSANIEGVDFTFKKPIRYKYTDPVKGEIYQPVQFIYPMYINSGPSMVIFKNDDNNIDKAIHFSLQANMDINDSLRFIYQNGEEKKVFDSVVHFAKGEKRMVNVALNSDAVAASSKEFYGGKVSSPLFNQDQFFTLHKINYDHIPNINYNFYDRIPVLKIDLKITGKSVGYITGAGDKVPQALEQMGYKVTLLKESDINETNLLQFDAVITGVRAYNTNEWMSNVYDALMGYVKNGGVLLVQYNTSNQIGPVKAKMAPYPFNISRTRVTDETAKVNFLLPNHPSLNYPNKITEKDFEGWIQERSVYHAEKIDSSYQRIFSMKDAGEKEDDGSLIIANYGKGKFVYTGLVFFRELPAAVPGAFRLLANLIAAPIKEGTLKATENKEKKVSRKIGK